MRSAGRFYCLWLAYAAAGMAAVGVVVVAVLPALDFTVSPGRLIALCNRLLLPVATVTDALVLGTATVALLAAGLAVRSLIRELLVQRRLRGGLDLVGRSACDRRGAKVIEEPSVTAFCAGLLRPRVYVSRGAVQALSEPELEAVLTHERHHAARRDPLRLLAIRVLGDALFMLPAVKRLGSRYRDLAELAADQAAVRARGSAAPLASALLKFGQAPAQGVTGIAPERVDHLLGDPAPWRLPVKSMAVGALGAVGLAAGGLALAALGPDSVSVLEVVARSCMLGMSAAGLGLAVWGLTMGRRPLRLVTRRGAGMPASR